MIYKMYFKSYAVAYERGTAGINSRGNFIQSLKNTQTEFGRLIRETSQCVLLSGTV